MQYKYLGQTGTKISNLCFGTMTFGGEADEATASALFSRCREAGINLFDCANVYNEGRAEEILGRLIKNCRDKVLITSKVYFPCSKDINECGTSRWQIKRAVENSLRRLNTDYIDIYFLHRFDENTPLEESLRALDDLVHQGKVIYLGVSNFAAWQVTKALGIAVKEHLARFCCIQPMYNLLKRQAEVEILPMALSEQLAVISYNPLAGGMLTGKYNTTEQSTEGRLATNPMYQVRYGEMHFKQIVDNFTALAKEHGFHPASLAIAWVINHPVITAALLGARNVDQLDDCLRAAEINLTPELRATISALSPTPPLATDRNDELDKDAELFRLHVATTKK